MERIESMGMARAFTTSPRVVVVLTAALLSCGQLEPRQRIDEQLADFRYLREKLEEIHPDLTMHRSREEIEALSGSVESRLSEPLSAIDLFKELARFATFFQDGHTFPSMEFAQGGYEQSLAEGNSVLPIDLNSDGERLFITTVAQPELEDLLGAEVLSINGRTVAEIAEAFQHFYSKRAARFDAAHTRLFRTLYWLSFGSFNRWTIEARVAGQESTLETVGMSRRAFEKVLDSDNLRRNRRPQMYDFAIDQEASLAILTVHAQGDFDRFAKLLRDGFAKVQDQQIQNLVIDMRENGGGSSALGDELYAYLSDQPYAPGKMYVKRSPTIIRWYQEERPDHPLHDFVTVGKPGSTELFPLTPETPRGVQFPFRGNSYLLIGSKTFSSGHMFAGLFKCHSLGTVIGQPTGQATRTPGDAFGFTLPHSRLMFNVSYKVFEGPCEPSLEQGFQPDHLVTYTAEERAQGIDKEMLLVADLMERQQNRRR